MIYDKLRHQSYKNHSKVSSESILKIMVMATNYVGDWLSRIFFSPEVKKKFFLLDIKWYHTLSSQTAGSDYLLSASFKSIYFYFYKIWWSTPSPFPQTVIYMFVPLVHITFEICQYQVAYISKRQLVSFPFLFGIRVAFAFVLVVCFTFVFVFIAVFCIKQSLLSRVLSVFSHNGYMFKLWKV